MNAGRELDALIAEKVMGLILLPTDGETDCAPMLQRALDTHLSCIRDDACPAYSTDIGAAWLVVEKFKAEGYYIGLTIEYSTGMGCWSCEIGDTDMNAETAPHAICLAALKAVGHTVPE